MKSFVALSLLSYYILVFSCTEPSAKLEKAIYENDEEQVEFILAESPTAVNQLTKNGIPFDIFTVKTSENPRIIKMVLQEIQNPNQENILGENCLFFVNTVEKLEVVLPFVNIQHTDKEGNTYLHTIEDTKISAVLLEFMNTQNESIDKKNKDGQTPLMLALEKNLEEKADMLISYGACLFAVDKYDKSVLNYAEESVLNTIESEIATRYQYNKIRQTDRVEQLVTTTSFELKGFRRQIYNSYWITELDLPEDVDQFVLNIEAGPSNTNNIDSLVNIFTRTGALVTGKDADEVLAIIEKIQNLGDKSSSSYNAFLVDEANASKIKFEPIENISKIWSRQNSLSPSHTMTPKDLKNRSNLILIIQNNSPFSSLEIRVNMIAITFADKDVNRDPCSSNNSHIIDFESGEEDQVYNSHNNTKVSPSKEGIDIENDIVKEEIEILGYFVQVSCSGDSPEILNDIREKCKDIVTTGINLEMFENIDAGCYRYLLGEFKSLGAAEIFRDNTHLPFGKGVLVERFRDKNGQEFMTTIMENQIEENYN